MKLAAILIFSLHKICNLHVIKPRRGVPCGSPVPRSLGSFSLRFHILRYILPPTAVWRVVRTLHLGPPFQVQE